MNARQGFPYDQSFVPAFPALELSIHAPLEATGTEKLKALVDTGADGTLIPRGYLLLVGAPPVGEADIVSHWGDRRSVMIYEVDIRLDGTTLPNIFAVADDFGQQVILGRDVLNRLRLLLDGPAELTSLIGS